MNSSIREGHSTQSASSSRREPPVSLSDILMEVKKARKETAQLRNEVLSSIKGVQDELKELKKRTFQIKGGEFQVSSKTTSFYSPYKQLIYHALCEFIVSSSMLQF